LRRPRRKSKRKKGRKEMKLHSLAKNTTGTSITVCKAKEDLLFRFYIFGKLESMAILQVQSESKRSK
jgi:hypothetical protein